MTFEIVLSSKARKFVERLADDIALRIVTKLETVSANPFRYLEYYEGGRYYKFRIGKFRALISVDEANKLITVEVLDKRGRIYKR